jgi:hypothetical protein
MIKVDSGVLINNVEMLKEIMYMNSESIPAKSMKIDVGENNHCANPFVNVYEVPEKWNKDFGLINI